MEHKKKLNRIVAYIFRGWEDEPGYTHQKKILPNIYYLFNLLASRPSVVKSNVVIPSW